MPHPVAVIVLLVIVIGVYAVTRGLPSPWSPTTACKVVGDCPRPKTCDVATGACVDLILPGLLATAQSTTQAIYNAFQVVIGNYTTAYGAHVRSLVSSAAAMGISVPNTGNITAALTSGLSDLNKYIQQVLATSGCDPTKSTKCGYYLQIMALTPASPGVSIWPVAMMAPSVSTNLPIATQAFPPLSGELSTLVSLITADAQAKQKALDAPTQAAVNAVNADISQISGYTDVLTTLAAAVKQAGSALYNHYMNY
jgi:hypothetical protein